MCAAGRIGRAAVLRRQEDSRIDERNRKRYSLFQGGNEPCRKRDGRDRGAGTERIKETVWRTDIWFRDVSALNNDGCIACRLLGRLSDR